MALFAWSYVQPFLYSAGLWRTNGRIHDDIIYRASLESRGKNESHLTLTTPLLGWFVTVGWDLIQSTCVQNLTILALAIPEISLGASKFKVSHVTLTMPLLRWLVIIMLGLDIGLQNLTTGFSRSGDIISADQNLNGSRNPTTPPFANSVPSSG